VFEVQISTDVVEAPSYIILNQWLYFRALCKDS
jgi:hypothetical protein